jgi:hypothetical protein
MARITGGEITYGRTVKTGDYENKRVDVKLSFTVDDGEGHEAIVTAVAKEAHDKAHAMLGIALKTVAATTDVGAATSAKTLAANNLNAADADKAKVDGRSKAAKEAVAAKEAAAAKKAADEAAAKAKAEPEKSVEEQVGEDLGGFDEDAVESQPKITDAALSAAMNRKVAELKPKHQGAAPKLIKELINTFVEAPKKSHDIPQNLRGQFLKKLEALT